MDNFRYINRKISRQRRYQIRCHKKGLCIICGKERDKNSEYYCKKHHIDSRVRTRKYYGCKEGKLGKKGRPVKVFNN